MLKKYENALNLLDTKFFESLAQELDETTSVARLIEAGGVSKKVGYRYLKPSLSIAERAINLSEKFSIIQLKTLINAMEDVQELNRKEEIAAKRAEAERLEKAEAARKAKQKKQKEQLTALENSILNKKKSENED